MDTRTRRNSVSAMKSQAIQMFEEDGQALVVSPSTSSTRDRRAANRRFCACFRTRRGCGSTIITVVIFVLGGIGVALYFLWPRLPTISISDPYIPGDMMNPVSITGSPLNATADSPFAVTIALAVDVNVYSPNYENVPTNAILFSGKLLGPDNMKPVPNGPTVTGQAAKTDFKARSNTAFTMPLSLSYSITNLAATLDNSRDAITLLEGRCMGQQGAQARVYIGYTVSVDLTILAWTGFKPSSSGRSSFVCPNIPQLVKASGVQIAGLDGTALAKLLGGL
ncbi:hypothetical protein BC830DRAFT_1146034 [Chytriomyces sp. MP71]|nr:hypothetical protein BC830DRAFT_1146034 [Chytriomyces sp. MP71]